jgi:hypothetical protein
MNTRRRFIANAKMAAAAVAALAAFGARADGGAKMLVSFDEILGASRRSGGWRRFSESV